MYTTSIYGVRWYNHMCCMHILCIYMYVYIKSCDSSTIQLCKFRWAKLKSTKRARGHSTLQAANFSYFNLFDITSHNMSNVFAIFSIWHNKHREQTKTRTRPKTVYRSKPLLQPLSLPASILSSWLKLALRKQRNAANPGLHTVDWCGNSSCI